MLSMPAMVKNMRIAAPSFFKRICQPRHILKSVILINRLSHFPDKPVSRFRYGKVNERRAKRIGKNITNEPWYAFRSARALATGRRQATRIASAAAEGLPKWALSWHV